MTDAHYVLPRALVLHLFTPMKFHIRVFTENPLRKIQVSLESGENNVYFTWLQYTFFIISRLVLFRMRNISDRSCRENQDHISRSIIFFLNSTICEIMWKNVVEQGRSQMTIWRMCIACWKPKTRNTITEYVILFAFPQQQWLHEQVHQYTE